MAESEQYELSDSPEDGGYEQTAGSAANADDNFNDFDHATTNGESTGSGRYRRKRIGGPPTGPAAAAQRRRPAAAAAAAASASGLTAGTKTRGAKGKVVKLRPNQSPEAIDQPYVGEEIEGKLFCVCRQLYDPTKFMIGCDNCDDWFHARCVNITPTEAQKIIKFVCPNCRRREQHAKRAALNASTIKAAKRKHLDKAVVELTEKGRPKRLGKDPGANAQSLVGQWNQLLKEEWEEEEKRANEKELVPSDNYSDVDEEDILNGNIEEESDLYLTSDEEADAEEMDYWDIARSVGMDWSELQEYVKAKEVAGGAEESSSESEEEADELMESAEHLPAANGSSKAEPSASSHSASSQSVSASTRHPPSVSSASASEAVPMEATASGAGAGGPDAAEDSDVAQPNGAPRSAESTAEETDDAVKDESLNSKPPLEATASAGDPSPNLAAAPRVSTRSSMKKEAKAKRDELTLGLGLASDPEDGDEDEDTRRPVGAKRRRLLPVVIADSAQGDFGTPEMYKLPRRERDLALLAFLRSRRVKIQTELVRVEIEQRRLQAGLDFAHRHMLKLSFTAEHALPPVYDTLSSVPFSDEREQWREVLPCRACSGLIPIAKYLPHLEECAATLSTAPGARFSSLPQAQAQLDRSLYSETVICGCPFDRASVIYRSKPTRSQTTSSSTAPPTFDSAAPSASAPSDLTSPPSADPATSAPSSASSAPAPASSSSPPSALPTSSYCTRPRVSCTDHPLWEVLWEADISRKRAVQRRRLDLVNAEMSLVAERILERSEKESVDVIPAHPPGTIVPPVSHVLPIIMRSAYPEPHVPTVPAYGMATMSFMPMDAAGSMHADPRFQAMARLQGEEAYLQARAAASPHEQLPQSGEDSGPASESQAELRERQRQFEHDVKMLREMMGSQPFPMPRGGVGTEEERRMYMMQNHYHMMMMQQQQQRFLHRHHQQQQFNNYYQQQYYQHHLAHQQQQYQQHHQHQHQQQQYSHLSNNHSPRSQGQPALEPMEPNGASSSTDYSAPSEATASSSSPAHGPSASPQVDTGRSLEPRAESGSTHTPKKAGPQLSDTQIDALVKRVHNLPSTSVYSKVPISTTVSNNNNLTITVSQSNPPKPSGPQDPVRKPGQLTNASHGSVHVPNRINPGARPLANVLPRNYSTPARSASRSPVTVSPAVVYPHANSNGSSPSNGQRPHPPGTR